MARRESRATPPGSDSGDPRRRRHVDEIAQAVGQPARRAGQLAQLADLGAGHADAAALGAVGEQVVALALGRRRPARRPRRARPRRRPAGAAPPRPGRWRGATARRASASSARAASAAAVAAAASSRSAATCAAAASRRSCRATSSARARTATCSAASRRRSALRTADSSPACVEASSSAATSVGDALLPPVVAPQPLDADLVDELGHRAVGEPAAELGVGLDRPAQLAQRGGRDALRLAQERLERGRERVRRPWCAGRRRRRTRWPSGGSGAQRCVGHRPTIVQPTNRCLTRTGVRGVMPIVASTVGARPVQGSFDDLGTPLADVTFCVLDLETTGGDRADDAITEVGAVKVRGGECLGTFQTLVNPGRAIPPVDHGAHRPHRRPGRAGAADRGRAAVAARVHRATPCSSATTSASTWRSCAPPSSAPATRATTRCASTPSPSPAASCATRCPTAGSARWRRGSASTTARRTGRSTTPWPPPTCCTCSSSGRPGSACSGSTTSTTLASMAGHPQAAKLKLTSNLPRSPGVYLFCGHRDEVLYVGKATNLRQRVRSYFGREDRRRIGPMLREAQSVRHHLLPDPLSAEVVEARLIARLQPRYNRAGTHADRYCYVRLDVDSAWPRLAIVKDAAPHRAAPRPAAVADDGDARRRGAAGGAPAAPLLGAARPRPHRRRRTPRRASPPSSASPPARAPGWPTAAATTTPSPSAATAIEGRPDAVVERLTARMTALAAGQRYEEAATARDRLSALEGAVRRTRQMEALLVAGPLRDHAAATSRGSIDRARLVDVRVAGSTAGALPAATARPTRPRPPPPPRPRRRSPRPRPPPPGPAAF